MAVFARIEIEELKLDVIRAPHREIVLAFNHDLRRTEVRTLSLSLQVAYLGIIVRFAKDYPDLKKKADELLSEIRELSGECSDVLKLMRNAANSFQAKSECSNFTWDSQAKYVIENLKKKFESCLDKAKKIYECLSKVCPDPTTELEKIRAKVEKIVQKRLKDEYFTVENYMNHIRVSQELHRITLLQLSMVTIAALGSFITGIEYIVKTMDSFIFFFEAGPGNNGQDDIFENIRNEITLVVVATASAVFFESICISINELHIFIGDQYNDEKAMESMQHLMVIFMEKAKKPKNKEKKPENKEKTVEFTSRTYKAALLSDSSSSSESNKGKSNQEDDDNGGAIELN